MWILSLIILIYIIIKNVRWYIYRKNTYTFNVSIIDILWYIVCLNLYEFEFFVYFVEF